MWQDYVIAIGQGLFTLALIPSLRGKDKPHILTSSMTASVLYAFAGVYITLHMPGAAILTGACGIGWSILSVQSYLKGRREMFKTFGNEK